MAICGLDFGTSNSAVALPNGEVLRIDVTAQQPKLFRTVLFFPEDTAEVLAGNEAIERYQEDNAGRFIQSMKTWLPASSFSRTTLRNRTLSLEELIAVFLRRIRVVAAEAAGAEFEEVVLGRPARFSTDPKVDAFAEERLKKAAELAGFTNVRFLIEPIAAALAYEARLERDEVVLVADFGAGTTDLTVMHLGPARRDKADRREDVVASTGVYVGGDRFDAAIMKHKLFPYFGHGSTYLPTITGRRMEMPTYVSSRLLSWNEMSLIREKKTRELIDMMLKTSDRKPAIEALHDLVMYNLGFRLYRAIEKAKVTLSTEKTASLEFEEERISIHETITRDEFDAASAHLIVELEETTDELLARLPSSLKIDSVFLTGGSSHVPAVQQLFARKFGAERLRTADAFTSVVEGLGRASKG
ncbi:MAG: Hsp70 family protein [Archangium gephyra]|uniref:Hsp70 family protein n=1 Tax=Archangium gephyra TaxID=48 RepID=A0A2W5TAY4_9BACT|nr:MAG: Hsp70 family protein [Archangium gephyra]